MKKYWTILILVLFFCQNPFAQSFESFSCPVEFNGRLLKYPFTGGFNAPQLSQVDFNRDGIQDLMVFEPGGTIMVFEYSGSGLSESYSFTRKYNQAFPFLDNWVLMRDYDNDGLMDVFGNTTQGRNGISLFQAQFSNGEYNYIPRRMGRTASDENLLWLNNFNNSNLYVTFTDLPEIIDVDNDGDLDVLSFGAGETFVNYNKNLQVEKNLPIDTMDFELHDLCFGKFKEDSFSSSIALSNDEEFCASAFKEEEVIDPTKHNIHAGSTVMGFDNDDDGDIDLILGDLASDSLVYLENGGTPTKNFMTSFDSQFPSYDNSVGMPEFLSAFNVDVDGDQLKDIIVTPHQQSNIKNQNNILYYKNTGNANQRFSYRQNDFLGEETLDFGNFSAPVFLDYNADGLQDILIGTGGPYINNVTTLSLKLFENTGSINAPSYILIDDDYLGFSQYASSSNNPGPAIGDIDGDGDDDMILGDQQGYLYFVENSAGAGMPYQFGTPTWKYMDIWVGSLAKPQIIDVNNDGLGDLVIGETTTNLVDGEFGIIQYFQNQGTVGNAFFDNDVLSAPNTPVFGKIDLRPTGADDTSEKFAAAPFFFKVGEELHVLIGTDHSNVFHYKKDDTASDLSFIRLDDFVGDILEGRWVTPTVYDIDDDGFYELLLGCLRGGVSFFKTDMKTDLVSTDEVSSDETIGISPNPVRHTLFIEGADNHPYQYKIFDVNGSLVLKGMTDKSINISSMVPSIYFIQISQNKKTTIKKFIKI